METDAVQFSNDRSIHPDPPRIPHRSLQLSCRLPASLGGSMHGASRPNFGSWARRTSDEALPLQLSARIGRVPAGQALPERIV